MNLRVRDAINRLPLFAAMTLFAVLSMPMTTSADTTDVPDIKVQVDQLNSQIKDKRSKVKELDNLISGYKDKIAQQEAQQASLGNEVLILDNRVLKINLDIDRAKAESDALTLEISSLSVQIDAEGKHIDVQKSLASDLLRRIREMDDTSPIEVLLTKKSLSAFFDRLNEMKKIEGDLVVALDKVKADKTVLEANKKERDDKKLALLDQQAQLKKDALAMEAEKNMKLSLATETQNKQSEFESILSELRAQQQSTSDEISSVETKLKDKLDSVDQALARGDVLLNWPVDSSNGVTVTCKFHDPTYPFRNLFEHPGVDLRASVGTSVKAAAGGYVAWNKQGRLYGNYMMVVHPGNIATVYAHLTKFVAKPDTYVERGQEIGKSGGMPGMAGAGLSTGPHLHFEVRQNGIPVDPQNFLPSAE